jgi:sialate O-acetylesterase
MISPLTNTSIRGAIWYQGESNVDRPSEYADLFKTLVTDWREKWHQGDFPFIYVQLPNFNKPRNSPSESNWALLREAQLKALSLPATGMAVAIELGEWNDIHPLRKKEVGRRLALAAQRTAYNDNEVVSSGPMWHSMEVVGSEVILKFSEVGSGLKARGGGELEGFSISGKDRSFVWANARIENDRVVVWSNKAQNPAAVRYAWADNPEKANLVNAEGLPASPFRTDKWTGR